MKKMMLIGALVVIVAVGTVLALTHKKSSTNSNATSTAMAGSGTPAATITYSGNGFSPASITVKANDTVAIKNTSSADVELDSDPHPVHTDDTDLNVGDVSAGQTKTFMVMKKGTFGYHNHLDPSQTGKITVE